MKTKTTLLATIILASLVSTSAFAGYTVQPVVKKNISTNISATQLVSADFELIESKLLDRDMRNGVMMNDIVVTLVSQDDNGSIVNISNNTMRRFSDVNLDLGDTGVTLMSALEGFTEITVRIKDTDIKPSNEIKFLDPNPLFEPNANTYSSPLTEADIKTYQVLQNNLKIVYGQSGTYEEYMDLFTNTRNEPRRNAWAKWHRTVNYNVTKGYRYTVSASGVSGGYWHAINSNSLKRYQEDSNFYHPYATLSHENGHSTGFKHGSGMTYDWQVNMKRIAHENDLSDVTAQNAILPQTNDFFWDYDIEKKNIRLFAKEGANFSGFEWVNVMYDSNRTRIDDVVTDFDTLTLPTSVNTQEAVIVLNAKIKDYDKTVNLVLRGDKITEISGSEAFLNRTDNTIANYDENERIHQEKRLKASQIFPESTSWTSNIDAEMPATITFAGEERVICKFQYTTQGMKVNTLLGVVEVDVCTIGETNTFADTAGFSSKPKAYQVVDLENTTLVPGDLSVQLTQEEGRFAQVCIYSGFESSNYALAGVGFRELNSVKCVSNVTAFNGNGWGMSRNYAYVPISPAFDYFPEDAGWGKLSQIENPLAVLIGSDSKIICRFAIESTQEFGFLTEDESSCTIGERNSINGIVAYSKDNFQVVDADYGVKGEPVTLTYGDRAATICYRNDNVFDGVSVSFNRVSCGKYTTALKKAYNGYYYGFSRGNYHPTF